MVCIRPFAALRPGKGKAKEIAALPYDVFSREEAFDKVKGDSLSFLRIDRPETQFDRDADMYAPEVYAKGNEMLLEMEEHGDFVMEKSPCFYLYELTMDGRSETGLVACSSVDDYENGVIKRHENTRKDKELDRIRHVDALSAQTGPIFLVYKSRADVQEIVGEVKKGTPLYDFVSEDGIGHRVWQISKKEQLERLTALFGTMDHTYIADGHHRAASAAAVSKMRREAKPDYTGEEEFNYFLSVLFPAEELRIFDYNRVLKSRNGFSDEQLLERISGAFTVERAEEAPYRPKRKGEMGLFLGGTWYVLQVKEERCMKDPVQTLDVAYLQREVLEPVFGIQDPRTDPKIDFVGGIRGLFELERRCREDGCVAAFAMYPTSMDELFAVADADLLMPPKSTWFEPKLRSGLFIHKIER